ncbi:MAG: reverse transcriptase domain-containing protein [Sedimenticola sp.]
MDYADREFIISGIRDGFHIVDAEKIQIPVETNNYKSATDALMRARVESQIRTELDNGRYNIVHEKPCIVSALGVVPKKSSNGIRLIHDASRPPGQALNDFAYNSPFRYQSLQDAVDLITPGAYCAKVDLESAYRSVKIHPSNYKATGLKWRFHADNIDTYMIDERLPFGASQSPETFHRITQAVRAIMAAKGMCGIIAYLDDFLIVSDTYVECLNTLNALMCQLRRLGFCINYSKVEGPVQQICFLGVNLDTVQRTLSIPESKMCEIRTTLRSNLASHKVTKRQLQSLSGKLNWITQCIYGGRFYMRRLIDRANALRSPWHRTRVTVEMKADILWWIHFMDLFNGKMPMVEDRPTTPVSIDACSVAAGAHYCGDWVYTPFTSPAVQSLPINYKEVIALEPAVSRWAETWRNKKVFVHSDNQAACAIINKGSCKHPVVMSSLRRIFWLSAVYNFRLKAVYYPGTANTLADAVSRLHEPNGISRLYSYLSIVRVV